MEMRKIAKTGVEVAGRKRIIENDKLGEIVRMIKTKTGMDMSPINIAVGLIPEDKLGDAIKFGHRAILSMIPLSHRLDIQTLSVPKEKEGLFKTTAGEYTNEGREELLARIALFIEGQIKEGKDMTNEIRNVITHMRSLRDHFLKIIEP